MKVLQHGKAVEKVEPPARGKFSLGDFVQKSKGSKWRGRIVGFYATDLTLIGYTVESSFEPGSVQIYPEAALEPWDGLSAESDRLAIENAKMRVFIFGDAKSSRHPNLLDLCFDAFTNADRPNSEDGGPSDWFNDTKPKIDESLREFAAEINAAAKATP